MMAAWSAAACWSRAPFARLMYLSLYKMHELALHRQTKVTLDTLARLITRRTEPLVRAALKPSGLATAGLHARFPMRCARMASSSRKASQPHNLSCPASGG